MVERITATLTPELSKAARRELNLTQNNVVAETGIQAYKLKQFEAGRFRPDMTCLRQLREFYEGHGINFAELEAHTSAARVEGELVAPPPRPGITPNPRPGFFITEHLSPGQIDRLLTRMEDNDDQIGELVKAKIDRGFGGGMSEQSSQQVEELFGLMAENHLIFRLLQGRNIVQPSRPTKEARTVGEFVSQWAQESPVFDDLAPSKRLAPRAKPAADNVDADETEHEEA